LLYLTLSLCFGGCLATISLNFQEWLRLELPDSDESPDLQKAALEGDVVSVKRLLGKGEDPNEEDFHDMTPLMYAACAKNNATDVAKVLLPLTTDIE